MSSLNHRANSVSRNRQRLLTAEYQKVPTRYEHFTGLIEVRCEGFLLPSDAHTITSEWQLLRHRPIGDPKLLLINLHALAGVENEPLDQHCGICDEFADCGIMEVLRSRPEDAKRLGQAGTVCLR